MSFLTPAPQGARVGDLLHTAVRLFQASLLKCLPLGMVAVLCASLPNVYWNATTGHSTSLAESHDVRFVALSAVGIALGLWLYGAMMLRQRAVVLGAPILLGAELLTSLRHLPVMLLASLLANLSVGLGLVLLVAPGVYLLVCYVLLVPVILFDHVAPLAAIMRSVRMMRQLWWPAFAALVIAALLSFIGAIVFAAVVAVLAEFVAGNGAAMRAVLNAGVVASYAVFGVYFSALQLVLHSAASNSA